jgi:two-component system cell cycle response regulator
MAQRPIALPGGRRLPVTLSIGVSSLTLDSDDTPFTLIDKADQALYAAKNQGRNTVVLADTVRPMVPRRRKKPTFEPVRQLSLFDAPKRQVNGT